ncbi:hypothetical protein [Wolbachia endosymbiont of Frankliniella intonsa]|uniref:hypothetical protein n=1 Tax=Wolbachia endosymbiont of Frankliniella intonsa TaxID=2902422 RepID=UPI00244E6054|nr:hypothetical protein [Wolbachia endosymbiont of Frankliniella intonsa]WGJ61747.1 hypothetical protein M3L71_05210 [Wolbachia endosymbiont of Frankliniella intonsa]
MDHYEKSYNYHKSGPGYDLGDSSNLEPPPPYSPQDPNTAPSAPSYDETRLGGLFSHSNEEKHSGNHGCNIDCRR